MPTFTDPATEVAEMYESMRGLAHASILLDQPERMHGMLGDLRGAMRSLEQILGQFAKGHTGSRGRAMNDAGDRAVGTQDALTAAAELRQAAALIARAGLRVEAGMSSSERITWQPAAEARDGAGRLVNVVFLQGGETDDTFMLIDKGGIQEAILDLSGFDFGDETVDAALENGYVYDEVPVGPLDRVATLDVYTLVYNRSHEHVALYRTEDSLPTSSFLDLEEPLQAARADTLDRDTAAVDSRRTRRERLGNPAINRHHSVHRPEPRGL